MPERQLSIATYAVGASLCAISLLYVFGPGFAFDGDASSGHKRRIVGLENPANMCFCNSVLQALANSPGLRKYLIREVHRRNLDGPEVYRGRYEDVDGEGRDADMLLWKLDNLQQGIVSHALKKMLDRLNERPIYKKTITATDFIYSLETAFRTRISRQQQDAQELLQIVLERLCDEYHAGSRARRKFKGRNQQQDSDVSQHSERSSEEPPRTPTTKEDDEEEESKPDGEQFPFEGQTEARIECKTCGFTPKPAVSSFVTLTLNVPQQSQTSLNLCFDGIFREETIEGFKCDKCRLLHAQGVKEQQLTQNPDRRTKKALLADLAHIQSALENDPERPLDEDAHLPPRADAPARTITRSTRLSRFPRVLAIHLSRSIYSTTSLSTKNTARVAFPETLSLGPLLNTRQFRLSAVVMHKGGHNSGHYETFRRQFTPVPYSTPHSFGTSGVYSREQSPNPSALATPVSAKPSTLAGATIPPSPLDMRASRISESPSQPSRSASTRSSASSRSSLSASLRRANSRVASAVHAPTSAPRTEEESKRVSHAVAEAEMAKVVKRQKKLAQRWWRVSDEKVKESKTTEVLGMQKEVYLLFYEAENVE
ncbi:cysteine proteinase [Microthyrium microscopicum]|uniref:Ubiquitin carboxyl-terminal hydrolase n=1 Tax=Microthyrium microscopicum TaxID=703497 RepID=A0A6A6TVT6_9PEZI|nr:cysteine proteinase [Microthyrium microscopicum]